MTWRAPCPARSGDLIFQVGRWKCVAAEQSIIQIGTCCFLQGVLRPGGNSSIKDWAQLEPTANLREAFSLGNAG